MRNAILAPLTHDAVVSSILRLRLSVRSTLLAETTRGRGGWIKYFDAALAAVAG